MKELTEQERQNVVEEIETLTLEDAHKSQLKVLRKQENILDDELISGWIRESVDKQTIFPIDLNYIILKFYASYDKFDDYILSQYFGVSGGDLYCRNDHSSRVNIFGSIGISRNDRKIWKIAIVEPGSSMFIGVIAEKNINKIINGDNSKPFCCLEESMHGFGVCSHNGNFHSGHRDKVKTQYIYPFDDHDVDGKIVYLTVNLDLVNGTLSFKFDNFDGGIAQIMNVDEGELYRLAITLPKESSVYLIR